MTWYLDNLRRYREEHEGIEALANEVNWLTGINWHIDQSLRLIVDVDLMVGDTTFPIYLRYPNHFPNVPPSIFPRDASARWSSHQYGAGGELCLEYGPDNWEPRFAGADLLRSTQRLLAGEASPPDVRAQIPSRHRVSSGQELRNALSRLLLTEVLRTALKGLPAGLVLPAKLFCWSHEETFVNVIQSITLPDGTLWTDLGIPRPFIQETFDRPCSIACLTPDASVPVMASVSELRTFLATHQMDLPECKYFVITTGAQFCGWYVDNDNDKLYQIRMVSPGAETTRNRADRTALAERRVAVIGCGAIGSKVAVSLARAGINNFVLVDDDLVLPENLVRHDLDWRDIGTHKASSVARRIELVNPAARCNVRLQRLAGQQSSGSFESLITTLAACDLVIDATADPRVFNTISAVAFTAKKPVLWAETFGGGFGGFIARHRPGMEPQPQLMRSAIDSWFAAQDQPMPRPIGDYEIEGEDGPLVADDADVSVIAANATRLALDTLLGKTPSDFPYSVYLIGLANGSVFSQPFDTYPLDVGTDIGPTQDQLLTAEEAAMETRRILDMFLKSQKSEDSSNQESNRSGSA